MSIFSEKIKFDRLVNAIESSISVIGEALEKQYDERFATGIRTRPVLQNAKPARRESYNIRRKSR